MAFTKAGGHPGGRIVYPVGWIPLLEEWVTTPWFSIFKTHGGGGGDNQMRPTAKAAMGVISD